RIGPMYGTQTTERLKRGFSFSDVLSIGTQYQVDEHEFIITYSLRHTSNAGLKFPNSGHNSSGFQISYAYLF
ncbi:MAG: acyloxyacyl hydrolase, partial [Bacteroidota bacterium]|nr:acyloxyacyl hydrolase [Bacteroidota bacterium]